MSSVYTYDTITLDGKTRHPSPRMSSKPGLFDNGEGVLRTTTDDASMHTSRQNISGATSFVVCAPSRYVLGKNRV